MSDVLVVGASRGLGDSLVQKYALGSKGTVYATSRSKPASEPGKNVKFIPGIDLCSESAGSKLASQLAQFDANIATVIITAGYFSTETFEEPKWEDEIKMQVSRNIMIEPRHHTVHGIRGYLVDAKDFFSLSDLTSNRRMTTVFCTLQQSCTVKLIALPPGTLQARLDQFSSFTISSKPD